MAPKSLYQFAIFMELCHIAFVTSLPWIMYTVVPSHHSQFDSSSVLQCSSTVFAYAAQVFYFFYSELIIQILKPVFLLMCASFSH